MAIVNISTRGDDGKPTEITANLLGPIVMNVQKRLATPAVLYEGQYSHRHPIPLVKNKKAGLAGFLKIINSFPTL